MVYKCCGLTSRDLPRLWKSFFFPPVSLPNWLVCLNASVENRSSHQTGWPMQRLIVLPFLVIYQRRALRTASEKLRNRTSFSATAVQHSPATRVNRYIGRLIEARQTESGTSDLNYFTLFYRNRDRERKVRTASANEPVTCVYVYKWIQISTFLITHEPTCFVTPPSFTLTPTPHTL